MAAYRGTTETREAAMEALEAQWIAPRGWGALVDQAAITAVPRRPQLTVGTTQGVS
jgi:hypothetical protein